MKSTSIQFSKDTAIELSFATITPGKEPQIFGEYFPKVLPIVGELDGQSLGSFAVADSASGIGEPKMGALFQWPDLNGFTRLHSDPRFQAIKGIRDEALELFSNGHFFTVENDTEVTFDEGRAYLLRADWNDTANDTVDALVTLRPSAESPNDRFAPKRVTVSVWDESADELMAGLKENGNSEIDAFQILVKIPE